MIDCSGSVFVCGRIWGKLGSNTVFVFIRKLGVISFFEVSVWLQLIQICLQWLELRTGVWDHFFCWSGFGVCELALQWLEVRVGVCDPSFFV